MIEFDKAFRQKGDGAERLNAMWVVISALGKWLCTSEQMLDMTRKHPIETSQSNQTLTAALQKMMTLTGAWSSPAS